MHPRMILTIFRKDARDAIRDARVLAAILVPLGLGLLYNVIFKDTDARPQATVVYYAAAATTLPDRLRETAGSTIDLTYREVAAPEEVRPLVERKKADVGVIVPAGFDEAVRRGEAPPLTIVLRESGGVGGSYVAATLDRVLRAMAGQNPPAQVSLDLLAADTTGGQAAIVVLGPRRYFVLSIVIFLIAMIGIQALPIILTEETERKTLDALTMIASYADVVAAKALVGLAYIALSVTLLLGLTRLRPADPVGFTATVVLLSLSLVGLGLLLGGIFRTAGQVNTWGSFLLMPLLAPAFLAGLPLPRPVTLLLNFIPTSQAAKLAMNGLSGREFFPDPWLSYLVIVVWGAVAYALLLWRLRRREA